MKNKVFTLRVAGIMFLLFILACNCKKVRYDYSELKLGQYYIGNISDNEIIYLKFQRADSVLNGSYFIHKGNALVEVLPFTGRTCKRKVELNFFETDGVRKSKGNLNICGDTIRYFYGKKKNSGSFVLEREKIQRQPVLKPRYNEIAFEKVRKTELNYGKARGYYTSKPIHKIGKEQYASIILEVGKSLARNVMMRELALTLDLYEPVGDPVIKRPLLLLIHGGAFIIGDKDTETMRAMADYFVKRGYVVASINYRMGYMFIPGGYVYLERSIYRAVQDTRAALRFLVHHADKYRIDTDYIFVGGNSAGGFTALKTAFMQQNEVFESASGNMLFLREDLGCLDCSGNNLKDKFSIRGVINMWGALTDTLMIGKHENIPVLLFHGDADEIVPPGHQYPFANMGIEISSFFCRKTYGSVSIYEHLKKLGINSKLVLFPGADHDPQLGKDNQLNENMDIILENIRDFVFEIIVADSSVLKGKFNYSLQDVTARFEIKGKGKITANWQITGGKIIQTKNEGKEIEVVWFVNEEKHGLRCLMQNENGLLNAIEKDIIIKQ
jgi:acetyl esterase/lipase